MKKEEIIANCIEEIRNGKSTVEECLNRYPNFAAEILSILEIASHIKPDEVNPSPEFKRRAKLYLFEKMQETPAKKQQSLFLWPRRLQARTVAWISTGLIVFSAASCGTVYAAQASLPGDGLYPVKIGIETIQLALTSDAAAKADLHLDLVQRRIDEVAKQVELGRNIDIQALQTVKQQYNNALKELSNLEDPVIVNNKLSKISINALDQQIALEQVIANAPQSSQSVLEQTLDETRRGSTIAEVGYANQAFLDSQPSVNDEELDKGQFKIDGTLLSIQDRIWNVGGTIIRNVYYSGDLPVIGSRVKIQGVVKDDNLFIIQVKVSDIPTGLTKVEGQFGGTNQDGTADVGGVSVQIEDTSIIPLEPGDKVQLQGNQQDNTLKVTGKESQGQNNKDIATTLDGILTAVNTTNNTITVKATGNQITVDVSQAKIEIKDKNVKSASLSELNPQIGQDVKVEGLSKKNDSLSAKQVRVTVDD